jgi:hypothetical protein
MSKDQVELLEQLKTKHSTLERRKMQGEAQVQHLTAEREALLKEMKEEFGVDSLDDLRSLSEKLKASNEESLATFSKALEDVEKKLSSMQKAD